MRQHRNDHSRRQNAPVGAPFRSAMVPGSSRRVSIGAALVAVVLLASLVLGGGIVGGSQSTGAEIRRGTPEATPAMAAPTAAECWVKPRTITSLRRLNIDAARFAETVVAINRDIETGIALGLVPFNVFTPVPIPSSTPEDANIFTQINATYRELEACALSGDTLRRNALFTDTFFTNFILMFGPLGERNLAQMASPEAVPIDEYDPFFPITPDELRQLPDGRIGVLVPAPAPQPNGSPPPSDTQMLIFTEQGDRYLVDDLLFVSETATPIATDRQLVTPIAAEALQTVLASTPIVPGSTSMLAIADGVELHADPSADAPVLQSLAAGQLVRVQGSAIVTDGETWWPVRDPSTDTNGFVLDRLLIVARNELTGTVEDTTLIDGTPVLITPNPDSVATAEVVFVGAKPGPTVTPSTGQ